MNTLQETAMSPRELAAKFSEQEGYFFQHPCPCRLRQPSFVQIRLLDHLMHLLGLQHHIMVRLRRLLHLRRPCLNLD